VGFIPLKSINFCLSLLYLPSVIGCTHKTFLWSISTFVAAPVRSLSYIIDIGVIFLSQAKINKQILDFTYLTNEKTKKIWNKSSWARQSDSHL
jgi:hypothetical protein